jgi:repressor LexA
MENASVNSLSDTCSTPAPFPSERAHETVDLAAFFLGPGRFALRINGNALPNEGILPGDVVIVCPRPAADGDLAVAANGDEVVLGRAYHDHDGGLTLYPGPQTFPRKLDGARLVGVVVAQFRSYG